MTGGERFSLAARGRSFGHAFRGVAELLRTQHNAWIHAAVTLAVVAAGVGFGASALEWAVLCLAMGLVWAAEGVNTALETLGDAVSADSHPLIGRAKDVAAAAVLLASIAAAAAGLCIFVPKALALWEGGA